MEDKGEVETNTCQKEPSHKQMQWLFLTKQDKGKNKMGEKKIS